jgi:hypothetical protein
MLESRNVEYFENEEHKYSKYRKNRRARKITAENEMM